MAGEVSLDLVGVLSLLDARNGGRGRMVANTIVVDALRNRLEDAIPSFDHKTRIALLEASWPFSCLPELRSVSAALLETWPGSLPKIFAETLHKWPEDSFIRLPKIVRFKSSAVPEKRRIT